MVGRISIVSKSESVRIGVVDHQEERLITRFFKKSVGMFCHFPDLASIGPGPEVEPEAVFSVDGTHRHVQMSCHDAPWYPSREVPKKGYFQTIIGRLVRK